MPWFNRSKLTAALPTKEEGGLCFSANNEIRKSRTHISASVHFRAWALKFGNCYSSPLVSLIDKDLIHPCVSIS